MPTPNNGDENKGNPPAPTPGANGEGQDKTVEQEVDFDKELQDLESGGAPVPAAPKSGKTKEEELSQAIYTGKSVAKRIKALGGDPSDIIADEAPVTPAPEAPAPMDTSKFVTKDDLASIEARKLARTEGEYKVIMWWVANKGLSVDDAHLMANKGRIKKTLSEINRAKDAIASNGGGGPGSPQPTDPAIPEISEQDKQRLAASGMIWDPAQKAYVGKRVMYAFDGKAWNTKRITPKPR